MCAGVMQSVNEVLTSPCPGRSAISAFTRIFDALWRRFFSGVVRCRAGAHARIRKEEWVPALRSGMKSAVSRVRDTSGQLVMLLIWLTV